MQRVVRLTANIAGEDLGRVADAVERGDRARRRAAARRDRRRCAARSPPLEEMLREPRGRACCIAVVVIFLLLAANFQSLRLALVVVSTVPAVLAGVVLIAAALTGTTLNVQSFMGAIMAIGVAVANAILLVTFAEQARHGRRIAAARGASRPRARGCGPS